MKRVHVIAGVLLGVLLGGCGGSSLTNSDTGTGTLTGREIEAVYSSRANGDPVDPENIEFGETVQFRVVAYTSTGAKVIESPGLWKTSDLLGAYGTLAGNSGLFLAGDKQTAAAQIVYTEVDGQTVSAYYRVNPRQVRLSGNLLNADTSAGVPKIQIEFFDNAGVKVGQVKTGANGKFLASIPTTAESFQITDESVPTSYYRSFTYNGVRYDTGRFQCRVTIPVYDSGPKFLPFDILLTPKAPDAKPDPDGCTP
ncbi:MAG: hypothetical protein ACOYON_02280 [Fimbriimonas sp.]